MKITGVIAEYNPLHGGHKAMLDKIRKDGSDYIIVAMSGDFVQRGEPAIFDKATRTKAALMAGADLVLEIPVMFSTSSAPDFTAASVALLDKLHVVDELCFGSESGEISPFYQAARILSDEPDIFRETLKSQLASGHTYAKAMASSVNAALREACSPNNISVINELFSSPNNILGTEYVRALIRRNSSIRPVTYKREGQAYHDDSTDHLSSEDIPSASAIRNAIKSENFNYTDYLCSVISYDRSADLSDAVPIFEDDLSELLNERILNIFAGSAHEEALEYLEGFADLTPELAGSLSHHVLEFDSFTGRCAQLKSKAYTYARISRALLHIILDIRAKDTAYIKENDYISYARILGFKETSEQLLHVIHENSTIPLITKTAGAAEGLGADGKISFKKDLFASHLYQSLVYERSGHTLPNEYTREIIIL